MWFANPGWWGAPNHAALDAPPAVATTTWDPANQFQIALSNGNLTVTNSAGAGNFGVVRGIASHSTGKFYCEWKVNATDNSEMGIGVCNASQAIAGGAQMGTGANNCGLLSSNGTILFNGSAIVILSNASGTLPYPVLVNDVMGMAVDIGAGKIWYRKNAGVWNTGGTDDPVTGLGGGTIGVTGALFLFSDVESNATIATLNAGATAYANAAPSGYGNW